MELNKLRKSWLNSSGLLVFQNKSNRKLFAERTYHWIDRITLIDETNDERRYAGDIKNHELKSRRVDFNNKTRI